MEFYLIQNWNHEYPEHEPYMVMDLKNEDKAFSSCDEYGVSDWLPYKNMKFIAANEDILWAFLGSKVEIENKTFLICNGIEPSWEDYWEEKNKGE